MDPLTLSEISAMSRTTLLAGDPEALVYRVSKDTRTISKGDLYVALRGGNFDGNHFVGEAASKGAVAAICDGEPATGLPKGFGVFTTPDPLTALTHLALSWRSRLKLRSVVITGSSGKTSTKDFTASVMRSRMATTATVGNLNNQIGLPLSILSANTSDEAAVWEIGMNHRGEIAPLAGLARPNIGIITCIGTAHIENLGSRENIAAEKGDLLASLSAGGYGVIPAEDPFARELRSRTSERILGVGFGAGEIRASDLVQDLSGTRFTITGDFGRAEAMLPVPGRHMVGNALLAVAAGVLSGIPLEACAAALSSIELTSGRLGRIERRGVILIDDTYNANPDSMVAALETLSSVPAAGRKIAVLGRMGELGAHAAEGYARVGRSAAGVLDILICVGEEASAIAAAARDAGLADPRVVADNAAASALLSSLAREGDLVLLKASRSARMEEVLANFN